MALSKVDRTLAIVDSETFTVLARIPVGQDPHEVVVSSDGKTAYVSNTGSGLFHEINVIDLEKQKALSSFDTEGLLGPHGLKFLNGKVWFTAEGAKSVARFDPATRKTDLILGIGQDRSHMIQVSADEKTVFVANVDSGSLSIFENLLLPPPLPPMGVFMPNAKPQMGWRQTIVPAGKGSEGFDISPNKKELWIANAHAGTISVVDLASKKVSSTLDTSVLGISRVKFAADGARVLITSLRTGDLLVFDAKSRKEIKRIKLGQRAAHILIDPSGKRAFVSCTPDNYVVVVDLEKLEVRNHIDVGGRPDGLEWVGQ